MHTTSTPTHHPQVLTGAVMLPGGRPPTTSLGSMDAPADLMDLKHAFDSAAPVLTETPVGPTETGNEDMPPISPEISAAFAAPPAAGQDAGASRTPVGTPGKASAGSTRSLAGLPATAAPAGVLFNVINAETLETAAQQVRGGCIYIYCCTL